MLNVGFKYARLIQEWGAERRAPCTERSTSRVFLRPCRGFAESAISPTVPPYGSTVGYYPTPLRGWTGLNEGISGLRRLFSPLFVALTLRFSERAEVGGRIFTSGFFRRRFAGIRFVGWRVFRCKFRLSVH